MGLDTFSPVAPARVRALVIPTGQIKKSKFVGFVERLRQENVVRLGDVSPGGRPHRTMFSPLAFPDGLVLYDISPSLPPSSHLALAPFEVYRLPLLVIGIADGASLLDGHAKKSSNTKKSNGGEASLSDLEALSQSIHEFRREYASSLVHCILAFDYAEKSAILPEGIIPVPALAKSRTTTIKTIMCDLTSLMLAEMTTYAKSIQGLSTIATPRADARDVPNGVVSALPAHIGGSSISDSAAERSRSFSPAEDARLGHRTSMPAHILSIAESRASSPDSHAALPASGTHTPPITFEDMNGNNGTTSPPRASNRDRVRPGSQDRIPNAGSGPGSMGERHRSRGRARIGVVIGALYLLAGRWPDAMKELAQSATTSRGNSDYAWQAKAMDYLIPDVLRPSAERPSMGSSKFAKHSPSSSQHEITLSNSVDPEKRALTLQSLASILPDLINNATNLYGRAWSFTEDKIPAISFSHSTIRFAKLLTALNISHGYLNDDVLRHLVMHTALSPRVSIQFDLPSLLGKSDILALLLRAYPDPSSESSLSKTDRTETLAAIAALLSELGYHRKKALILKGILSTLLPALVQARKEGAAEMGVHPAASLVPLNATFGVTSRFPSLSSDDVERGVQTFLTLVCHHFGIILQPSGSGSNQDLTNEYNSTSALLPTGTSSSALELAILNGHGPQDLKIDILRSCINVCEALPDISGALQYSAALLRTAGSGIAPGPENTNSSPALAIEDQVRLANYVSRTLSAAQQLGLKHPEADYWDEFLIRGMGVMDTSEPHRLTPHAKSELELVEKVEGEKKKDPFIYNPFLRSNATATTEPVLVANEEVFFEVTLQNLYDFDLTIESIVLETEGVQLDCPHHTTVIGPYRTQTTHVSATPRGQGSLTVTSCRVKVRGCRVRTFSIYSEPWALKADVKGRNLQIPDMVKTAESAPTNGQTNKSKPTRRLACPKATSLALEVIESQPIVTIKSSSLARSAIMLLEGETKVCSITLQNISSTTPVDFVFLSFFDSTTAKLQDALASKELSASELYELELSSIRKPAFRWLKAHHDGKIQISPGGGLSLDIEILGKPGLIYGMVHVDYGFLGVPKAEIEERFYTRHISFPITVTVNSSINLLHNEIRPLAEAPRSEMSNSLMTVIEGPARVDQDGGPRQFKQDSQLDMLLNRTGLYDLSSPHCLLLLDFRNLWVSTLTLTLRVSPSISSADQERFGFDCTMYPNTSTRIPIPLPRIYLPSLTAYAQIPSLNKENKRQFVVSTAKASPEVERNARESFWYREEILKWVSATWKEESTGRSGAIELRDMKLSPTMIEAYKLYDMAVSMSVEFATSSSVKLRQASRITTPLALQKFQVPISTFLNLRTTLHNRSPSPIRPLLRLQPTLVNQPYNIALDLNKELLVNGVLQRALPTLGPGETQEVETDFVILSKGIYQWGAVVEEIGAPTKTVAEGSKVRERANTGDLDLQLYDEGRRIWVAEMPCVVIASDEMGANQNPIGVAENDGELGS
ncbi:MAG: hypothetical protein Q9217_001630 [Psora testacea]